MRLHLLSAFMAPLTAVALLACGGDDLVLPTGETPASRVPAKLSIYSGNEQEGTAGAALAFPAVVQVVDENGDGLAGQTVSWNVATGEGSATPTSVTDEQGLASSVWTLGNPGPNTLTATVAGLSAVTFIADANNGRGGGGGGGGGGAVPSATTSTISADPTSIQVETGVSSIRVTVRDAAGAPVSGAVVTLSASGSGNTLVQPTGPTGSDGIAVGTLRSTVAGTKDITAIVNGTVQVAQTAQIVVEAPPPPPPPAAEPHHFVFRVQPQDVREDEWFTVEVAIADASGNIVPLNGTEIYLGLFEVGDDHPTNSRLAGDRFEDTVNGVATFRLYVDHDGSYRFLARSDYLPEHLGPYGPELFSNVFQVRD